MGWVECCLTDSFIFIVGLLVFLVVGTRMADGWWLTVFGGRWVMLSVAVGITKKDRLVE
jgi:hypothetical protein